MPGVNCYECSLSRDEFNHIMLRTGCADVVRSQTAKGRVATTPISASIVGALQVQEAMKIIHLQNPEEDEDKEATPFKTLQGRMLRYEGMTNTMNIYKISSWKNTCAAHEQWTDVIAAEELSASQTVEHVLAALKNILNVENVEINMCNNKFIDVIATDYPQKEFEVMLPESKLDNYIKKDKELRQLSYRTLIHKHFYENIDNSFPYQSMTLQQIGIPAYDVLQVSTEKGVFFVELSADRY